MHYTIFLSLKTQPLVHVIAIIDASLENNQYGRTQRCHVKRAQELATRDITVRHDSAQFIPLHMQADLLDILIH